MNTNQQSKTTSVQNRRLFSLIGKIKLFLLIVFLISIAITPNINAQSYAPPLDSYINLDGISGTVFVSVPDSTSLSEIEVSLGNKGNSNNLFNQIYTFDQTSGLASGLSYSRSGLQLLLGFEIIGIPPAFDVRVRLKNIAGNWSNWFEYTSN